MSAFNTRVELHGVQHDSDKYTRLHERMAARGFSRRIKANDGRVFELPPAEYHWDGTATNDQIRDLAKAAAAEVVTSYAVLVTKSAGCVWSGLKQVA